MMIMSLENLEPIDAFLDRQIEELVGKQVRGELTDEERVLLTRLVARQARNMRPSRMPNTAKYQLRRA